MNVEMQSSVRQPGSFLAWFDPRHRQPGTWAFALNRLSGLGLTFYLFLHLIALSQLAQGPAAYDGFIHLVHAPAFILGELVVVVGALYHGLNGIRVILTGLGWAVPYQRLLFWVVFALTALASLVFALRMFNA